MHSIWLGFPVFGDGTFPLSARKRQDLLLPCSSYPVPFSTVLPTCCDWQDSIVHKGGRVSKSVWKTTIWDLFTHVDPSPPKKRWQRRTRFSTFLCFCCGLTWNSLQVRNKERFAWLPSAFCDELADLALYPFCLLPLSLHSGRWYRVWSCVLEETLLQCQDLASSIQLLKAEHFNTGLELVRRIQERLLAILQHATQVTVVFARNMFCSVLSQKALC